MLSERRFYGRWRRRWSVRKGNAMHGFPVVGGDHFNRVPGAAIEEGAVGAFARAFLTADAEIWIDFDTTERRMILVWNPEHAGFDRAVFDAGRGTGATCAAVGCDRQYSRSLLARRLAIAL